MINYIKQTKKLIVNNNLVYLLRTRYSYVIYEINKDRNYSFIFNIYKDHRFKRVINNDLNIRY